MILSSLAYFAFSRAVTGEVGGGEYRQLLWGSFFTGPHQALIEPLHARISGMLAVLALSASATISAVLMRRVTGSRASDALPEIIVFAIAAIVVPPLLIATLFWPDGRGWLTTPLLLAASGVENLVLFLFALRRPSPAASGHPLPPAREGSSVSVFLFGGAALLYGIVVAIFALSSLRGFDSLAYHLPLAASWLSHSRLTTNVEESATFFFPANAEVFIRWMLTISDRIAFVPSFLEALACLYVLFKIARELGQSRVTAAVAACSAASCVLFSFIAATAYIDAFMALTLLLSVLFLLRAFHSGDLATTIALGTAVGLALGSKYSAIQPVLVISAIWFWRLIRRNIRAYEGCFRIPDWRAIGRDFVPFAIPVALCSAYWYVRNAVEHGNPLFPFAIFGMPGLPMRALIAVRPEMATWADWLLYPWRETRSLSFDDDLGGVFGGVALIGVVAAIGRRPRNRSRDVVLLVTIASFLLWLLTGNFVPRYGIFPLLLSFLFVGDLWKEHSSTLLRVATFALFLGTLFIFGLGLATQAVYVTLTGRPRYGVPAAVDRLPSSTILNGTSAMANYYLMGRDYRHNVISTFRKARPADVAKYAPDFVLVEPDEAASFSRAARLDFVAASDAADRTPAVLYRVTPSSAPTRR